MNMKDYKLFFTKYHIYGQLQLHPVIVTVYVSIADSVKTRFEVTILIKHLYYIV